MSEQTARQTRHRERARDGGGGGREEGVEVEVEGGGGRPGKAKGWLHVIGPCPLLHSISLI